MKINQTYISLKGIQLRAYHGVDPQEHCVGGIFIVDIRLKAALGKACESDDLNDTINYASVYHIIKEEMNIPSKLLEHVCARIAEHLFKTFHSIENIEIKLTKKTPPIGADCEGASFELFCER